MNELEHYLPTFDFRERHLLFVKAGPQEAYHALKNLNYKDSWLIRFFFWLRGIHWEELEKGFTVLYEKAGEEVLWGLIAKPWYWKGEVLKVSKEEFISFKQPGFVKIAWNFTFDKQLQGTLVTTETRVLCMDKKSLWKFRLYWFFIRSFSGLIRKQMLALIKLKSEKGT